VAEPEVADATRRTRLANERTYLAWLRSALTALAVAVGIGRLVPGVTDVTRWPFELVGAGFAVLAMLLVVYGARRYVQVEQALTAGRFAPFDARTATFIAAVAAALAIGTFVLVFIH
jgi:inner membrane protein YidH